MTSTPQYKPAAEVAFEVCLKSRDALAAQLAQVSGDLVRANNENWRLRRDNEDMARALTATHETLGHMGAIEAELDAARSALDEVTRERDAATKALEVAEAHAAKMTQRWEVAQAALVEAEQQRDRFLGLLGDYERTSLLDDEKVGVYERTARIRAEHKAIAELTAENARLRQALAAADRLGDEAMDCCLKAVNMLDGMRVERDEARALLAEAVSQGGDSGLWVVVEFDPDGQIKDIEFPLYESRTEAAEIAARISWSRLARLVWDRALLTEALKDGDE